MDQRVTTSTTPLVSSTSHSKQMAPAAGQANSLVTLAICVGGIYASFLVWALVRTVLLPLPDERRELSAFSSSPSIVSRTPFVLFHLDASPS